MPLESVEFDVDPRSILAAVKAGNDALASLEKGATNANAKIQSALERQADMLLKVTDKQRQSHERVTQAVERQAAAYGKMPIDRMIAERDRLIKKLGDEQGMVNRVTAAYEKMIQAENAVAGGGGAGNQGRGFSVNYAIRGVKDVAEGRGTFAVAELVNELGVMRGLPLIIGGVTAGIAALGFAAYETKRKFEELAEAPHKAARAMQDLNGITRSHNDELRLENDRLADTIAKLEHKPRNLLAEALDEARLSADRLAESLSKDVQEMAKLVKENSVGFFAKAVGHAGTGDLEKWIEKYQNLVRDINYAGNENVHRATTPDAAKQAQDEWNRALAATRSSALGKIAPMIAEAEAPHIAGKGSLFAQDDDPTKRATLLNLLRGIRANLNTQGDVAGLEDQSRREKAEVARLQGIEKIAAATEGLRQELSRAQQGELNGLDKINAAYDERLRHLREEGQFNATNLSLSKQIRDAEMDRFQKTDRRLTETALFGANNSLAGAQIRSSEALFRANRRANGAEVGADDINSEYRTDLGLAQNQFDLASRHVRELRDAKRDAGEIERAQIEATKTFALAAKDAETKKLVALIDLGKQQRDEEEKTAKASFDNQKRLTDAVTGERDRRSHDLLQRQIRMVGVLAVNTPEGALHAAGLVEQLRISDAQQQRDQSISRINQQALEASGHLKGATGEERRQWEGEINRLKIEGIKAEGDLQRQVDDAHEDRVLKIAEIQKQQMETLKKTSEGLLHTLFTDRAHFLGQFKNTIRDAALKPIEQGIASITANVLKPVIFGQDGQSGISGFLRGIFGGGKAADPMKLSTDFNTTATVQNSAAIWALTAALAAGPAFGMGGGSSPAGSTFASLASSVGSYSAPNGGEEIGWGHSQTAGLDQLSSGLWRRGPGGGSPLGDLASMIGPGGTGGFAGPLGGSGAAPAGSRGLGGILGNLKGTWGNLKNINWGGLTHSGDVGTAGVDGQPGIDQGASGGKITGVDGIAGAALSTGGMMLAQQGLLGSSRGTWAGVGMGALGGAAVGFALGGPLGAAIGGGVGLAIGLGEKIAGVETPEREAARLIKSIYGLDIASNSATIKQIVAMSKQSFGGSIGVAVRSQEVRDLLQLYADSTGQKSSALLALQVHSASLVESGGSLYQRATYNNGTPYTYASNLPTFGPAGSTLPTAQPGPIYVGVNVNGGGLAGFMTGQYVTSDYVQNQFADAQQASNGRLRNASTFLQPGLVTS